MCTMYNFRTLFWYTPDQTSRACDISNMCASRNKIRVPHPPFPPRGTVYSFSRHSKRSLLHWHALYLKRDCQHEQIPKDDSIKTLRLALKMADLCNIREQVRDVVTSLAKTENPPQKPPDMLLTWNFCVIILNICLYRLYLTLTELCPFWNCSANK